MTEYRVAAREDMELLMSSRLEMLRVVNGLPETEDFDEELVRESREYFESGEQTTILAQEWGIVIGCATLCYIRMMPTFSHPTGKRAHLMNVYVREQYRRQGIAVKMAEMLIQEATARGVTEISLDATPQGRLLYERMGFAASEECMVLPLGK
ncbi:MAG: GNAT family N-acetyltransferase [bacterium]|nr:GNAT family N-acetyltransferase [bacterium]MCM1375913.1 GNAT family N-acetyltransferase [Muribaculum sp.]